MFNRKKAKVKMGAISKPAEVRNAIATGRLVRVDPKPGIDDVWAGKTVGQKIGIGIGVAFFAIFGGIKARSGWRNAKYVLTKDGKKAGFRNTFNQYMFGKTNSGKKEGK